MKIEIDFKNKIIRVEEKDSYASTIESIIDSIIQKYPELKEDSG